MRSAAGGWQQSTRPEPDDGDVEASSVTLQVTPPGVAALVWLQTAGAVSSVKARYGATTANAWGAIEDVSDAGRSAPTAAIADDGTAVAVWERATRAATSGRAV